MFISKQNLNYSIVEEFSEYRTKPDKTKAQGNILVSGSQNVLLDQGKIKNRKGYTIDGAANASISPVKSGFTWKTSRGFERVLRGYDDELEVRFVDAAGDVNWVKVADGWADSDFSFAPWWGTTENLEVLLFVIGNDNIYEWGGGVAEVASVTASTITKKGTETWAQTGFYTTGNKTIVIDGVEYAYTGGETTTTLTGVTPDPSAGGVADGDIATQKIITNANTPVADWQNDQIAVLNNQLYIINEVANEVYISSDSDYTDFTFSAPRVPGEGELLVLDSAGKAAIPLDQDMLMAAGDDWYRTSFDQIAVSSTLTETLSAKKLRTGKGKGLKERDLVANFGNAIVYISNDNELQSIERSEQLELPITANLSDPIKPSFDAEDFTGGHVFSHKNRIYVSSPVNGYVYILEFKQTDSGIVRFWQPLQILPIRRFVTVSDAIYGHSSQVPETYKLFDGTDDNAVPFLAKVALAYNSYGKRELLKSLDEWFTEGYISSNGTLTLTLNFELDGAIQQIGVDIVGGDSNILFGADLGSGLGDNPLGDEPLGIESTEDMLPKFRHIFPFVPADFFEIQATYEMESDDGQFELLAAGGNVRISNRQPNYLKRQITNIN